MMQSKFKSDIIINSEEALFELIRIAMGKNGRHLNYNKVLWDDVCTLSKKQGVLGVAFGGYQRLETISRGDDLWYKWLGMTVSIERKYVHQVHTIESLADFFQKRGVSMILLKGFGLSLNYPTPSHRSFGDIDIYTIGEKGNIDEIIEKELGIIVTKDIEKHSTFIYRGEKIENHNVFFDEHTNPSNEYINGVLSELINGRLKTLQIGTTNIFIPNPTFMAIHLLRHSACDFAANTISLRQLLDWATLVEMHRNDIEWPIVCSFVDDSGMSIFFEMINEGCISWLEVDPCFFPCRLGDRALLNKFKNEIFHGHRVSDFSDRSSIFSYGMAKSWQFWRNLWKYRMVYNDSPWSLYKSLVKNRLTHYSTYT